MRILFALPGLHRVSRGAEVAFISIARALAGLGEEVSLIGSGQSVPDAPYKFIHAPSVHRERLEWLPSIPGLRNDCAYEELTFVPGLLRKYQPHEFDVTLTCGYPYTNWVLRARRQRGVRPAHVFVTQNGDHPATTTTREYRFFGCEGLVCTNPDYFDRCHESWRSTLIPNGVDVQRFRDANAAKSALGLPASEKIVLMVSALVPTKRVALGIEAISQIENCHLVVAGDGPERTTIDELASQLMPGRFSRLTVPSEKMPSLYKSAEVFMHLSKEESFGNVFLEAMAAGLPVVAPDTERIRWIVGDDNFLFHGDEAAAVANATKSAFQALETREFVQSNRVTQFSWDRIGEMYKDFLGEVVESHRDEIGL